MSRGNRKEGRGLELVGDQGVFVLYNGKAFGASRVRYQIL